MIDSKCISLVTIPILLSAIDQIVTYYTVSRIKNQGIKEYYEFEENPLLRNLWKYLGLKKGSIIGTIIILPFIALLTSFLIIAFNNSSVEPFGKFLLAMIYGYIVFVFSNAIVGHLRLRGETKEITKKRYEVIQLKKKSKEKN